jgi:hypothetical protein
MITLKLVVDILSKLNVKYNIDGLCRYFGIVLILYSILLVPFPGMDLDLFHQLMQSWPIYPLNWFAALIFGGAFILIRTRYVLELYCLVADMPNVWHLYKYSNPYQIFNATQSGNDPIETLVECESSLINGLRTRNIKTKQELLSKIGTIEELNSLLNDLRGFGVVRRDVWRMVWVNFAKPEIQRLAYLRNRRRTAYLIGILVVVFADVGIHSWLKLGWIETRLEAPSLTCRQAVTDIRFTYPMTDKEQALVDKTIAVLRNGGAVAIKNSLRCENTLLWLLVNMQKANSASAFDSVLSNAINMRLGGGAYCSDLALFIARATGTYGRQQSVGFPNAMAGKAYLWFDSALSRDPGNIMAEIGKITAIFESVPQNANVEERFSKFDSCVVALEANGRAVRKSKSMDAGLVLGRIRNNLTYIELRMFAEYWTKGQSLELKKRLQGSRYRAIVDSPLAFLDLLADSLGIAATHYPHYGVQLSLVELGGIRAKYLLSIGAPSDSVYKYVVWRDIYYPLDSALSLGWPHSNLEQEPIRRALDLDVVDSLNTNKLWFKEFPKLVDFPK